MHGLHQSHAAAGSAGALVRSACSVTCCPRLLEIIYEINERFLAAVAKKFPAMSNLRQRVSLIEEGGDPHIRMSYL